MPAKPAPTVWAALRSSGIEKRKYSLDERIAWWSLADARNGVAARCVLGEKMSETCVTSGVVSNRMIQSEHAIGTETDFVQYKASGTLIESRHWLFSWLGARPTVHAVVTSGRSEVIDQTMFVEFAVAGPDERPKNALETVVIRLP